MFNTSFSYEVVGAYQGEFSKILKKEKSPARKFNLLLAFTYCLLENDVWMHDFEVGFVTQFGGGAMITGLAGHWRRLLKNSAKDLGLDDGYSYEGAKTFLQNFKKEVEGIETYNEPSYKFNY